MDLRPDQLSAQLGKPLAPLWVVHGNAPLLSLEAADAIRAAARAQGFDERETLVVDRSFKWSQLALAGGNLSLFGGAKLIDLRIPGGKPGREGGEALQAYVANPPANTLTLISFPELDWPSRKTVWFKALSAAACCIECNSPERAGLPQWIRQRLAQQQLDIEADALEFLCDHVEGNLLAAHQEILKLALLHPGARLNLDQIRDAVLSVSRYRIEDLRDAILSGDSVRCLRLLEGLRDEAAPPPLLLWSLSNELRILNRLSQGQAAGQPLNALLRSERIFDAQRQRQLGSALQRLSLPRLRRALLEAARLDRILKGVHNGEFWEETLLLALSLARSARPASG
ncbi:MAG: DNA polymerase III subunit delta [Thauera sp.]|jgi:DNA polymerase-3 subunit delta|nr:DNA polymerase III subunit delta [Thauera sp.]